MREKEDFIVKRTDVFEQGALAEGLENLGPIPYPFARTYGKLFSYRYTVEDMEEAKETISSFDEPNKYVVGVALDLRRFLYDDELLFDEEAVGIWKEMENVPEVFRKEFEEQQWQDR